MEIKEITIRERKLSGYPKSKERISYNAYPKLSVFDSKGQDPRLYRKEGLVSLALVELGLPLDTKVSYGQYAGCWCGCSPEFVIKDKTRHADVYIVVER